MRDPATAVGASLLLVVSSADAVRTIALPPHGEVSIGRGGECTVAFDDASLSRRHATLALPALTIVDRGSRNGTWIGGVRLAEEVATEVAIGRAFRLGQVHAIVVRLGAIDRGALRELDAQVSRARNARSPLVVLRGAPPIPAWVTAAGGKLLAATDELWLATLRGAGADTLAAQVRDPAVGVATFPASGLDAGELYLAADRDRLRRGHRASAIDAVHALAARVAASNVSVLIQGETGVGKELLAELIHRRSPRAEEPLIKVNCAAFAPALFESEVFGHERGAFTGAVDTRIGLLEVADGGTLFLDEIAELSLELQAKLLRVIEDRVVARVGASQGRRIDVRFIAASNERLVERVERGAFRMDLYYRIAGVTIRIPPLRERKDEIQALAELFVFRATEATRTQPPALGAHALADLVAYDWPGNIRQLRGVIERAVLLCDGPAILPAHLMFDAPVRLTPPPPPVVDIDDRDHVLAALARCGGNQTRTARLLGIARNTLLARLDRFGAPRPRKPER